MNRLSTPSLVALAVLLATGCGSSTLSATDYDQSCAVASDCVAVLVGDMCECSCEYEAISATGKSAYDEDRAAIECSVVCSPCPDGPAVLCSTSGTCETSE